MADGDRVWVRAFQEDRVCPADGYPTASVEHIRSDPTKVYMNIDNSPPTEETLRGVLVRVCQRCKFKWHEIPLYEQ